MTPSCILFDLDGTLVDSANAICDAASAAFGELQVLVDAAEIRPHLGAPLEELFQTFVGSSDDTRFDLFVRHYIRLHDEHPEAIPDALPGVRETLDDMTNQWGVPFGVATTKPSDRAAQQLQAIGLAHYFHHIQGTDEGMRPKPSPDVILAALDKLGQAASKSVWMVGDTNRDIEAAHEAGLTAILISYSQQSVQERPTFGADHCITHMSQLISSI